MHLKELQKETAIQDIDKVVRLQSITTTFQLRKIEEFPSTSHAQKAIEEYPFLMQAGNVSYCMHNNFFKYYSKHPYTK